MNNEMYHFGIQNMHWGERRYQNKDGTLTEAGRLRYRKERYMNSTKKKDNRLPEESVRDVSRWVEDDLKKKSQVAKASSDLIKELQKLERETSPQHTKQRMDLSKMTDQELRQRINRELIERQYNDLFGKEIAPKITKGRKYAKATLNVAGGAMAGTLSALNIALAIKYLRS